MTRVLALALVLGACAPRVACPQPSDLLLERGPYTKLPPAGAQPVAVLVENGAENAAALNVKNTQFDEVLDYLGRVCGWNTETD